MQICIKSKKIALNCANSFEELCQIMYDALNRGDSLLIFFLEEHARMKVMTRNITGKIASPMIKPKAIVCLFGWFLNVLVNY